MLKKKKKVIVPIIIVASIIFIGIGVACVLLFSISGVERKYNSKIELAEKYYEECNYEKAIAKYREAIELRPEDSAAYIGLAEVYADMAEECLDDSDVEGAIEFYESAIEVLEEGIDICNDTKELEKKLKKHKERLEEIKSGIEKTSAKEEQTTIDTDESDLEIIELDAEIATIQEDLIEQLTFEDNNGYITSSELLRLIDAITCGMNTVNSEDNVNSLLSGNVDRFITFYGISNNGGWYNLYEYRPPEVENLYYGEFIDYQYLYPLDELEYDAYSITGCDVDFESSSNVDIIEIDSKKYIIYQMVPTGIEGEEIPYVSDIRDVVYIGDNIWRVDALVSTSYYNFAEINYSNMKYCDVSYFVTPNEDSYYGYNIVRYEIGKYYDRSWTEIYSQKYAQIGSSGCSYYTLIYIDEDDVPEMVYYEENKSVALAIYTIVDGEARCALKIQNGSGIMYGEIKYLEHENVVYTVSKSKESKNSTSVYEYGELITNVTKGYNSSTVYAVNYLTGEEENNSDSEYYSMNGWKSVKLDGHYEYLYSVF